LTAIAVDPDWQHRGIGTRMFDWLTQHSALSGALRAQHFVAGGGIHYGLVKE
jgi:N-acetylglutamate synthase-like GNAT family acetyltransferase